jgi:hypothetical protein
VNRIIDDFEAEGRRGKVLRPLLRKSMTLFGCGGSLERKTPNEVVLRKRSLVGR